jgi:hypothetical protein
MGGGKGGGAAPPPRQYSYQRPRPPGRETGLTTAQITENADGTFSSQGMTAGTRAALNRMLAARRPAPPPPPSGRAVNPFRGGDSPGAAARARDVFGDRDRDRGSARGGGFDKGVGKPGRDTGRDKSGGRGK